MAADTRTKLIESTAQLVQARGYHGTSLSDILKESGAPRGSLYFHFPGGKKALVLEAMKAGIEETNQILKSSLVQASNPAEGIRNFYRIVAEDLIKSDYRIGCPVAPVALDTPEIGSELDKLCRETFALWNKMYCETFMTAGLEAGRANRLARTVLAALEGALMIARSERNTSCLSDVGDEMAELIYTVLPAGLFQKLAKHFLTLTIFLKTLIPRNVQF